MGTAGSLLPAFPGPCRPLPFPKETQTMSQTTHHAPPAAQGRPGGLDDLGRRLAGSKAVARCLVAGLPTLGALASVFAGLPPFAALMAACFLLATALTCRKALAAF